eukprot:Pgem_evm1s10807
MTVYSNIIDIILPDVHDVNSFYNNVNVINSGFENTNYLHTSINTNNDININTKTKNNNQPSKQPIHFASMMFKTNTNPKRTEKCTFPNCNKLYTSIQARRLHYRKVHGNGQNDEQENLNRRKSNPICKSVINSPLAFDPILPNNYDNDIKIENIDISTTLYSKYNCNIILDNFDNTSISPF